MLKNKTVKFPKKKPLVQSATYLDQEKKGNCSKDENLLLSASFLNTPITRTEMAVHNLLQNYGEITDPEIRESLHEEICKNPYRVITRQMISVPEQNKKEAIETSISMVKLRNAVNNELTDVPNPIIEIKGISKSVCRNTSKNRLNLRSRSRSNVVSKKSRCRSNNENVTRKRPENKSNTKSHSKSIKIRKIHPKSVKNSKVRSTSKTTTTKRPRTVTSTRKSSKYKSHSKRVQRPEKRKRVAKSLPRRKNKQRSSSKRSRVRFAVPKRKASVRQSRKMKSSKSLSKRKMSIRNKSEARKTSKKHVKCDVDENLPLKRRKMQVHNKKVTEGCNTKLENLSPTISGKDVV